MSNDIVKANRQMLIFEKKSTDAAVVGPKKKEVTKTVIIVKTGVERGYKSLDSPSQTIKVRKVKKSVSQAESSASDALPIGKRSEKGTVGIEGQDVIILKNVVLGFYTEQGAPEYNKKIIPESCRDRQAHSSFILKEPQSSGGVSFTDSPNTKANMHYVSDAQPSTSNKSGKSQIYDKYYRYNVSKGTRGLLITRNVAEGFVQKNAVSVSASKSESCHNIQVNSNESLSDVISISGKSSELPCESNLTDICKDKNLEKQVVEVIPDSANEISAFETNGNSFASRTPTQLIVKPQDSGGTDTVNKAHYIGSEGMIRFYVYTQQVPKEKSRLTAVSQSQNPTRIDEVVEDSSKCVQCLFCSKWYSSDFVLNKHFFWHFLRGTATSRNMNTSEMVEYDVHYKPLQNELADLCTNKTIANSLQCVHCSEYFLIHFRYRECFIQKEALKCVFCWEKFRCCVTRKIHNRKYLGNSPYGCCVCSKSFTNVKDLRNHLEYHKIILKPINYVYDLTSDLSVRYSPTTSSHVVLKDFKIFSTLLELEVKKISSVQCGDDSRRNVVYDVLRNVLPKSMEILVEISENEGCDDRFCKATGKGFLNIRESSVNNENEKTLEMSSSIEKVTKNLHDEVWVNTGIINVIHTGGDYDKNSEAPMEDTDCISQEAPDAEDTELIDFENVSKDENCWQCEFCCELYIFHFRYREFFSSKDPLKCLYCSKCFDIILSKKLHIKSHLGKSPYGCCMCWKSFTSVIQLKNHLKGHDAPTVKPTRCMYKITSDVSLRYSPTVTPHLFDKDCKNWIHKVKQLIGRKKLSPKRAEAEVIEMVDIERCTFNRGFVESLDEHNSKRKVVKICKRDNSLIEMEGTSRKQNRLDEFKKVFGSAKRITRNYGVFERHVITKKRDIMDISDEDSEDLNHIVDKFSPVVNVDVDGESDDDVSLRNSVDMSVDRESSCSLDGSTESDNSKDILPENEDNNPVEKGSSVERVHFDANLNAADERHESYSQNFSLLEHAHGMGKTDHGNSSLNAREKESEARQYLNHDITKTRLREQLFNCVTSCDIAKVISYYMTDDPSVQSVLDCLDREKASMETILKKLGFCLDSSTSIEDDVIERPPAHNADVFEELADQQIVQEQVTRMSYGSILNKLDDSKFWCNYCASSFLEEDKYKKHMSLESTKTSILLMPG
ncbi:hypothetical protein SK128_019261, partial [Halocaridina rubra]